MFCLQAFGNLFHLRLKCNPTGWMEGMRKISEFEHGSLSHSSSTTSSKLEPKLATASWHPKLTCLSFHSSNPNSWLFNASKSIALHSGCHMKTNFMRKCEKKVKLDLKMRCMFYWNRNWADEANCTEFEDNVTMNERHKSNNLQFTFMPLHKYFVSIHSPFMHWNCVSWHCACFLSLDSFWSGQQSEICKKGKNGYQKIWTVTSASALLNLWMFWYLNYELWMTFIHTLGTGFSVTPARPNYDIGCYVYPYEWLNMKLAQWALTEADMSRPLFSAEHM